MPQKGSIIGQITEELGELGKKVATETAKAPVDIAKGIFEKSPSDRKPSSVVKSSEQSVEAKKKEKTPLDFLDEAKTPKEKQRFARGVLEYMRRPKKEKEPSVHEKKIMEEREKKEKGQQQARASAWQQLPNTGHAARRGDPRNIAMKQAHPEAGKNMRQE
ncbi:hypothetical protein HY031_02540 [Candidatus Gottesmanbacteria bacterium]|nr:hypothetical protein [Candidatus Gottesmanbacteria bacterium]MBI3577635.1 hypothetical protein [Candidatus Gottesmanbacteria bacterium]